VVKGVIAPLTCDVIVIVHISQQVFLRVIPNGSHFCWLCFRGSYGSTNEGHPYYSMKSSFSTNYITWGLKWVWPPLLDTFMHIISIFPWLLSPYFRWWKMSQPRLSRLATIVQDRCGRAPYSFAVSSRTWDVFRKSWVVAVKNQQNQGVMYHLVMTDIAMENHHF